MPITTDETDRAMNLRLANLFRQNPEFARNYFASPPRSNSSPTGRNAYARHVEAVQHVQGLLQREEAVRASGGDQPVASTVSIERQIREAQQHKAFGDANDRDHAAQVEYVGSLYRQLHPSK